MDLAVYKRVVLYGSIAHLTNQTVQKYLLRL